ERVVEEAGHGTGAEEGGALEYLAILVEDHHAGNAVDAVACGDVRKRVDIHQQGHVALAHGRDNGRVGPDVVLHRDAGGTPVRSDVDEHGTVEPRGVRQSGVDVRVP